MIQVYDKVYTIRKNIDLSMNLKSIPEIKQRNKKKRKNLWTWTNYLIDRVFNLKKKIRNKNSNKTRALVTWT